MRMCSIQIFWKFIICIKSRIANPVSKLPHTEFPSSYIILQARVYSDKKHSIKQIFSANIRDHESISTTTNNRQILVYIYAEMRAISENTGRFPLTAIVNAISSRLHTQHQVWIYYFFIACDVIQQI